MHIPGKTNSRADALSRPDIPDKGQEDNTDLLLLPPTRFSQDEKPTREVNIKSQYFSSKFTLNENQSLQESTKLHTEHEVLTMLKRNHPSFRQEDNIIYFQNRVYIPKESKLREKILQLYHDDPLAGHPGQNRTWLAISTKYWWPGLLTDVKKYIKGCEKCQQTKINYQPKSALLQPNAIPTRPWEEISTDIIGPLPESKGFDTISLTVDQFSKMIHLIPVTTSVTSKGMARLYRDHIWKLHGLPKKIISDRGPQYASKFMRELCNSLGIQHNLSTAYHL